MVNIHKTKGESRRPNKTELHLTCVPKVSRHHVDPFQDKRGLRACFFQDRGLLQATISCSLLLGFPCYHPRIQCSFAAAEKANWLGYLCQAWNFHMVRQLQCYVCTHVQGCTRESGRDLEICQVWCLKPHGHRWPCILFLLPQEYDDDMQFMWVKGFWNPQEPVWTDYAVDAHLGLICKHVQVRGGCQICKHTQVKGGCQVCKHTSVVIQGAYSSEFRMHMFSVHPGKLRDGWQRMERQLPEPQLCRFLGRASAEREGGATTFVSLDCASMSMLVQLSVGMSEQCVVLLQLEQAWLAKVTLLAGLVMLTLAVL